MDGWCDPTVTPSHRIPLILSVMGKFDVTSLHAVGRGYTPGSTNIAIENQHVWWYLPEKIVIFNFSMAMSVCRVYQIQRLMFRIQQSQDVPPITWGRRVVRRNGFLRRSFTLWRKQMIASLFLRIQSKQHHGTTDLVFYICKMPLDAWNLKELLALCRCRRCKWCFCLFTFFGSLSKSIGKWSHITSCFVASNFCTNASRIISKQWHHENVATTLPYSSWSHQQKAGNMLIVFGERVVNKTLILSFLEVSESFFPLFRPPVFLRSHKFFPRSYRGTERQQRPIWT